MLVLFKQTYTTLLNNITLFKRIQLYFKYTFKHTQLFSKRHNFLFTQIITYMNENYIIRIKYKVDT